VVGHVLVEIASVLHVRNIKVFGFLVTMVTFLDHVIVVAVIELLIWNGNFGDIIII
tara:strand:+ start:281 stop:448 length:168 start_codon:yes stop_codon:yes gene_type:complete